MIELEIKITSWALVSLAGAGFSKSKVEKKMMHQGGKEKSRAQANVNEEILNKVESMIATKK